MYEMQFYGFHATVNLFLKTKIEKVILKMVDLFVVN